MSLPGKRKATAPAKGDTGGKDIPDDYCPQCAATAPPTYRIVNCRDCGYRRCTRPACTAPCGTCNQPICAACQPAHAVATVCAHGACKGKRDLCPGCNNTRCEGCAAGHPAVRAGCGHYTCATAAINTCATCTHTFCPACWVGHATVAAPCTHNVCPDTVYSCSACAHTCCQACKPAHAEVTANCTHATCSAIPAVPCPSCTLTFCPVCVLTHATTTAFCTHPTCSNRTAVNCRICGKDYCQACNHTVTNASCTHETCPKAKVACARCGTYYCPLCVPADYVRDLCKTCQDVREKHTNDHIRSKYAPVPGSNNKLYRPMTVFAKISPKKGNGDRDSPPAPLSSGKTGKNDDIGDLKQFDRGHLVALELKGMDDHHFIAPMVVEFNRGGKWRKMEENIVTLLKGTDLEDVDDHAVPADVSTAQTNISLTLRTVSTVANKWHMEIWLFYEDLRGDPRIPVWFYVRVSYNRKLWTHFSLCNVCGKSKTVPTLTEMTEFLAAEDMYKSLGEQEKKNLFAPDFFPLYQPMGDPKARPNQILQFMHDVNTLCKDNKYKPVFSTFKLVTLAPRTPYDSFQREIIRKYIRYKTGGALKSDAPADNMPLYPGELKDLYPDLAECGGREAPEVDHIDPSYQQGSNAYINARLVSFLHNHLYREKKVAGSKAVNVELLAKYKAGSLGIMGDDTSRVTWIKKTIDGVEKTVKHATYYGVTELWITSDATIQTGSTAQALLDRLFSDDALFNANRTLKRLRGTTDHKIWGLVLARQTFLQTSDDIADKYNKEQLMNAAYLACHGAYVAGLNHFFDTPTHPERVRLKALVDGALAAIGGKLPLCKPSDAPGVRPVALAGAMPAFDPVAARGTDAYKNVFKLYNKPEKAV